MRANNLLKTIIPALALTLFSCINLDDETEIGLSDNEYELAVALVNTKITVGKLAEESKGNTGIKIDPDGRATLLYNGEVIRKTSAAIFPPFPGFLMPFLIPDTLSKIELLPISKYDVKKAVFDGTNLNFYTESSIPQDIKVMIQILELTKDGKSFEKEFNIKYNGNLPVTYTTEEISIDNWSINTTQNILTIRYIATTPDGNRIKLDKAVLNFDVIKFSYMDGYLGYHDFAVDGSIINIGLFDNWISGSFDFENPKISLSVENAFGLPVKSKVNKMELTSITGKTVNLESPFVTSGIDFAYPSFSEIGQTKTTLFDFNRNNSNIREIFNEKTKTISYDISALVNPERDTTIKGFITGDGYFVVNVAAEIPLHASVNQLVVSDTIDINLDDLDEVISAEFKAITSNDFPAEIRVQAFFADEFATVIDQLFEGSGFYLPAASLKSGGKTMPGIEKTEIISFTTDRFEKVKKAKRLIINGYLNTTGSDQRNSLWIYDNYGLGLKLGAKFKFRKK